MKRIEKLRNETMQAIPVFEEFKKTIISSAKKKKKIYCFYEGHTDLSYYLSRIHNIGLKEESFPCKNKKNVLKVHQYINDYQSDLFESFNIAYFIDLDYDKLINIDLHNDCLKRDNLYITDCYAIENYYTSIKSFKKILRYHYNLNKHDKKYLQLIRIFKERRVDFQNKVIYFNSFIACYKLFYSENKELFTKEIIYNDIKITNLFNISFTSITTNDKYNIFIEKHKSYIDSSILSEFNTKVDLFCEELKNNKCYLRGKFEFEFITKFLFLINNDIIDFEKINFHFQEKYALSIFSNTAYTPKSLHRFISKYK